MPTKLWFGPWTFFNQLKRLLYINLSRFFTKACFADVFIAFETIEIFFGKHVAKGIIGQPKQKGMRCIHLSFQVVTNIW